MTATHYKGGHHPGNDLGLHYTALPPIVASCPYSDQLLVTRKFWSPGANRPSQVSLVMADPFPAEFAALLDDFRVMVAHLAVQRGAGADAVATQYLHQPPDADAVAVITHRPVAHVGDLGLVARHAVVG